MILRRQVWVRIRAVEQTQSAVNDRLTKKAAKRRYRKHEIDAGGIRRMLTAYGRTVAEGDPEDLADLLAIAAQLDTVISDAVAHMRSHSEFTWQRLADAAGLASRQAAQQRWGKPRN